MVFMLTLGSKLEKHLKHVILSALIAQVLTKVIAEKMELN